MASKPSTGTAAMGSSASKPHQSKPSSTPVSRTSTPKSFQATFGASSVPVANAAILNPSRGSFSAQPVTRTEAQPGGDAQKKSTPAPNGARRERPSHSEEPMFPGL